jgi:hypothetical protein
MPDTLEKRCKERFNMVFSVYITGAWGSAFGIARNISQGGIFIESPDPYPLSSRMQITFYLPDGHTEMTAVGEVVHICFLDRTAAGGLRDVMVGMGIRFVGFVQDEKSVSAQPIARVQ